MAGRGPAGARVDVLDGARILASVKSDRDGEWVIILDRAMPPGTRELNLVARLSTGQTVESEQSVLIVVPEYTGLPMSPGKQEPQTPADKPRPEDGKDEPSAPPEEAKPPGPVALLLIKKPGGLSRLLQKPEPAKGLSQSELSIDKVDFDDKGRFAVSGSGAIGTKVRAYFDNKLIGEVTVGDRNNWSVQPDFTADDRPHMLRVDQVEDDGVVVARIEVPFNPERLVLVDPNDKNLVSKGENTKAPRIVVKPGENLWQIARKAYGEGTKYTVIYRANRSQIRDPMKIYPGQILELPKE